MPSSLQGLNIVYPPTRPSDNPSQDLLTPPPGFPDLTAQLDLWTHLSFASDEPFIDTNRKEGEFSTLDLQDQKLVDADEPKEMNGITHQSLIANTDKPIIDTSTSSITPANHQTLLQTQTDGTPGSFDLSSFLAGFGIDPFVVPPQPSLSPPNESDLASLSPLTKSSPSDISTSPTSKTDGEAQPPTKRTRIRKSSAVSQTPAIAPSALNQSAATPAQAVSEFSEDHDPLTTPLTPSEDKRRRNTAASARFRAKKKEREQALERRSKELEIRVTELERECEGLRRENGWLKGLVVGVTGSNPASVPKAPTEDDKNGNEVAKKRKHDSDGGTLDG